MSHHLDLTFGLPVAMIHAVSAPPGGGDAQICQDGIKGEPDMVLQKDTTGLHSNLMKGTAEQFPLTFSQCNEEEHGLFLQSANVP